jgi:hypothetical protein
MGTIFKSIKYTLFMGQPRPILDIITDFKSDGPPPTPSITPSITPTISLTPTFSPTPSITRTNTPTPSITPTLTRTPTVTPTLTPTQTSTPTPTSTPAVSFDPDAAAFLADVIDEGGTGITFTVSAATDTLFTELKSNGLYNDLFFYPMIGGVADSVALFGKRDVGTIYDFTWAGTPIFSMSGASGNGSDADGISDLNRTIYSNQGDFIYGCYITANNDATYGYELSTVGIDRNLLIVRYANDLAYVGTGDGFRTGDNSGGALGMYVVSQSGTTDGTIKLIKNGSTTLINATNSDNNYDTNRQWILRGSEYSNKTMGFAVFGKYLTDDQILTLSNIINTFQTSLGRNTY